MRISLSDLRAGKTLPINKPAAWSSFDVIKKIRVLTGIKKVGHAGTLDPFATGLLLVCTGPATKTISRLMGLPKEYVAEIQFGFETDTMDLTGTKTLEAPAPVLSREQVTPVLEAFKGRISQEIPAFSATKYKGRRLYKLARKGQETPQLFKEVVIHDLELLGLTEGSMTIRIECSSGTYVRSLGRDIARRLGAAGHLKSLVRTRIGDYTIQDAWTIEGLEKALHKEELRIR